MTIILEYEPVSLEFGLPIGNDANAWHMYEWQDEAQCAAAMSAPAVRSTSCQRGQKDGVLKQLDPLG